MLLEFRKLKRGESEVKLGQQFLCGQRMNGGRVTVLSESCVISRVPPLEAVGLLSLSHEG